MFESADPGEIIATDEGYDLIARNILDAVERGPNGVWRMPCHALQGGLPENAFSGRRFLSTNLLTLAAAARKKGHRAQLWAPRAQWEKKRGAIRPGEVGTEILVPVFAEDGASGKHWNADTPGMEKRLGRFGGDPTGGQDRAMLGFRREPWYNVDQVSGVEIREPCPPSPSQAAEDLLALLAGWRERPTGRRGPALLHGGHQAYWNPATDQVMSPPMQAYGDYDGLSGLEYYATTLTHEHIHSTGSKNRLNRQSLQQYGTKTGRAKEEMVAELGAAFLCGRFGLGTALRPDHALYVDSWLSCLSDRTQRKAFFWAVKEAEKAADFIVAQSSVTLTEVGLPSCGRTA